MSVKENLEIGAYSKRGRNRLHESMARINSLFPVLGKRKSQRAGTLSGGEQQMLAIGRALMGRPELLLIDELSLGLAPMVTQQIYRALRELGEDTTILLVEQNVELALNSSQRTYILESGYMTRTGSSQELMTDEDIRRAYLGL
jgi:branched-chain amino acid transport system ATP-binding protein